MIIRFFRSFVVVACLIGLTACGVSRGGSELFTMEFWEGGPFAGSDLAELGISEMLKGNYLEAESHFRAALDSNPRDVHALLGAAILYQNTGQLVRSRELYEAVLALRPDETQQFISLNDLSTRPISQVASVNLAILESGGVVNELASGAAGVVNQPPAQSMNGFNAGYGTLSNGARSTLTPATNEALFPVATMPGSEAEVLVPMTAPAGFGFSGADSNTISRFTTIRALRDQGLLTPGEYDERRRANIGALLPLTERPPAAGLDRPVPTTEQVTERLRAIGRALSLRAISVSQHSAERTMILDALMPAAPVVLANPSPPPQGLLEAADLVRRLEMLRDGGFISSDEYARERAAIEKAMLPPAPEASMAGQAGGIASAEPAALMAGETMVQMSGPQPGVHLASYRSVKQAEAGWSQLKRAHSELLGDLKHTVKSIDLGSKGRYYRLLAGPFPDNSAAEDVCRKLKSRRQFCDPAIADFG